MLAWPMCQVCLTVLGAGPADESIKCRPLMKQSADAVFVKRSRAAVLLSSMIKSIIPRPLHLQVPTKDVRKTTDCSRSKLELSA